MKYQLRKGTTPVHIVTDDHAECEMLISKGWVLVRVIGWLR
jgi:hypothetical protein